jgi:hypothetical protein
MEASDAVPIILLGFGQRPAAATLEHMLTNAGYVVEQVPELGCITPLLVKHPTATVVVYSDGSTTAAGSVLQQAAAVHHRTPSWLSSPTLVFRSTTGS